MGVRDVSAVDFSEQAKDFGDRLGKAVVSLTEMSLTAGRGSTEKSRLQAKAAATHNALVEWGSVLDDVWMGEVSPTAVQDYFTQMENLKDVAVGGAREGYSLVLDYGRADWAHLLPSAGV